MHSAPPNTLYSLMISSMLIMLLMVAMGALPAAASTAPRILVINSYHEGYDWSDDETAGLRETLLKALPRFELYSEYLDTKNFPTNAHFPRMADLLEAKYRNSRFDVIVVMDNAALEFAKQYRPRLFPGTPLVFCGINDYTPAMLAGQSPITGVAENQDSVATLAMALKLHPATRQVFVVHDYTVTGLAIRHELEAGSSQFPGVKIHFLEDMRLDQAVDTLKKLPADSLVLILSYAVEKGGRTFTQSEAAQIVSSASPVPAYAIHAAQLGHGIIGGKLLAGKTQGRKAAELAARIIRGTPTDRLPVITTSLSMTMIDYPAARKFKVDLDKLPPDALIINKPAPTYSVNKAAFWFGTLFTAAVTAGLIILYLNIRKRQRLEEELHHKTRLLEQEIGEHQSTEQVLRRERNNLKAIFDSAPVGMVLINAGAAIVSVNHVLADLINLESDRVVNRRLGEILQCPRNVESSERCGVTHLCSLCPLQKAISSALTRGESLHGAEIQHDFGWSTKHPHSWIRFSVEPLVLAGDTHVVISFDDITEKKQMEEQLRENEARLRLIFETTQSGMLLISPDGRIEYANIRMAEMFGCGLAELIGSSYSDFIDAEEWSSDTTVMQQLLRGDIACGQMERTYLRTCGGTFWGYVAGQRLERADGTLKAVVASITDISTLKMTVDELRAEKERLAVTLSSIGDGVITTDTEGRVVLINRVAEELCGWKREEAAGKPLETVFRIIGEVNRLPQKNPVFDVLSTGKIVELANHTLLISRSGVERSIADSAAPILNENREIIGVVLVFRDMTEKKHAEEEIFKARKLESIGVLAGGIAHDFNNFLTAILGNISLARMFSTPGERIHDILEKAETASNRAKGLTQQLLTFAKGGSPVRKVASIGQIISDSVGFVLRGSNVRFECDIADDLKAVEVDAGQMSQVINNLVINADQAMPDGGLLKIRAVNEKNSAANRSRLPAKQYVKITFEDQGVGIPATHLNRIFDPYFSTKQQGSGLGLATVYSIIRKHHGDIKATSRLGQGTTFTIHLPAAGGEKKICEEKNGAETHEGSGRILIMDDEEIIRDVLCNMLELLGYKTETCRDGAEALECYRSALATGNAFDAVIMDITIPGGIGGKEAIVMLRKIDPLIRAIVSSGYANDPIMARCREYGFSATLAKPYNIAEIGNVLKQVLAT